MDSPGLRWLCVRLSSPSLSSPCNKWVPGMNMRVRCGQKRSLGRHLSNKLLSKLNSGMRGPTYLPKAINIFKHLHWSLTFPELLLCYWESIVMGLLIRSSELYPGFSYNCHYFFVFRIVVLCIIGVSEDSSMVRFSRTDPMVSGLSPTSAKLSLRVRRVASSL